MRKVLIICYYWPPAGGPGVQRWLNFVKYLPEFGIEPVVYVPENPHYPMEDASFLSEVPQDLKVIKKPIVEPYRWASIFSKKKTKQISKGIISAKKQSLVEKLLLWIRGNFFIPDARKYWINPSVTYLKPFLKKEKIDTVITTGPPHSLHIIGLKLKEQLGINWVVDFRDPWTNIGYHSELKLTTYAQKQHKKLERKVLNMADKIITTSFTTKAEFESISKQPIEVITNGFTAHQLEKINLDKKFTLSHIGSLLSGRNPEILWESIEELIREHKTFKDDVQLNLTGVVSEDVLASIHKAGLEPYLKLSGYISHEEALKCQHSAQVLLLIEIDAEKTRGIIPGKLFEYMAAERPILAVGPKDWDVERILKETNTGAYFAYQDKERLKKKLLSLYEAYKNENLYVNSSAIDKFHRKSLTKRLADFI
ncbi:glycosyltransferase family 4 protein [Galbibacter sp. EGI 63066]|uniref:glycosyltransferase family 4 protein n=1 Tax=Galbibacter sp. EGI 63066 TaxID=2993559 RepID=UPI0022496606|nr:glycosyltransferase family 4 protein [Galbibacter sp. EGI 63066]MCX2681433.1 glycosyltransferase family 4 protein [Galbibacter sp. EGI 63066]